MNSATSPLVSVVIPTYNHAHFLVRALQSVIGQTHTNWEAIVIDNHSKDHTDEVVHSFGDPRITLLKIHNNGVIAASRNMGIRSAKGKWIAFLDSDDLWYPKKLETALKAILESPSIDVCSTDEMMVDDATGNGKPLKYGPYCSDFYKTLLVEGNRLSPSATLVSLAFLSRNHILFRENSEFVTVEDYDLWLLLARAGAKFKFINSIQGEYRIHATNNSGQLERHYQNGMNVLRDHVYQLQTFQPDKDSLWGEINARLLLERAKSLIAEKQFALGIRTLILGFRSSFSGSLLYMLSKLIEAIKNLSA